MTTQQPDHIDQLLDTAYALFKNGVSDIEKDLFFTGLTLEQQALLAMRARNRRLTLEKEFDQAIAPLKATYDRISEDFLGAMNRSGETSRSGTGWRATKSTTYNVSMPDPQAFYDFLRQSNRFDMMQRRLSSSVVKEYFDETQQLPPGVSMMPETKVTFYSKA